MLGRPGCGNVKFGGGVLVGNHPGYFDMDRLFIILEGGFDRLPIS